MKEQGKALFHGIRVVPQVLPDNASNNRPDAASSMKKSNKRGKLYIAIGLLDCEGIFMLFALNDVQHPSHLFQIGRKTILNASISGRGPDVVAQGPGGLGHSKFLDGGILTQEDI